MRMIRLLGAVPRFRTVNWWRWFAIGIFGAVFLIFGSVLDAAKGGNPGKPGDTDPPDPPPVTLEDGVVYYGWGWGYDPQEFWRMDSDGSNQQLLFTLDVESAGHRYKNVVPSKNTYGPGNSRYFACEISESEPSVYDLESRESFIEALYIVNESNELVIDILAGTNVLIEQPGQYPSAGFVWYDDDSRLAFLGREVTPAGDGWVVTKWDTLGIYTVDLIFDSTGDIVGSGPPTLVQWTNQWLVAGVTDYRPYPLITVVDFVIESRTDAPDRIYCDLEVDPGNPNSPDHYVLLRALFEDEDFQQSQGPELLWETGETPFRDLRLNPGQTILSGELYSGPVYYHLDEGTGYPEVIPIIGEQGTGWSAPHWSPSGDNIVFGYGIRNAGLTMKRRGIMQSTKDFENLAEIYRAKNSVYAFLTFGWRATPVE
ncbi:MAG TPA: hypothetical protein VK995_03665 [Oceanipulchritudo sp.]|nr:hypothetical protein [Oceanipulchritudo sp.]